LSPPCPLCVSAGAAGFASLRGRDYWRCALCELVFLEPAQRPSPAAERAEYELHRNDPADPGYRRHLARLLDPLLAGRAPDAQGLDFGCGPVPALALMAAERGFAMAAYDPLFRPDPAPLGQAYDFIAASEVAEHFRDPAAEFARLAELLRPGGRLGVMTSLLLPETDFARWRYRRERSHILFYGPATLGWLARRHGWRLTLLPPAVALFDRG
jgi:SAM-dependent methyltransferase